MEGTSELLAALLGAIVGGGITLWEANRGRRHERMARAVVVYDDLIDKRNRLEARMRLAGEALEKFAMNPQHPQGDRVLQAMLPGITADCVEIRRHSWVVMTADSYGLRRQWAATLALSLTEMYEDLHGRDLVSFGKHRTEEAAAYDGLLVCVSNLNERLPKLPQPEAANFLHRLFRPFR